MKHNLKLVSMAVMTALNAVCMGGEPLTWTRTPAKATPVSFTAYHGETLDLSCTFEGFGALPFSGDTVSLFWQTNGMGSAWWQTSATVSSNVVSTAWLPRMDPGAGRVTFFFGSPGNAYASALVRLLPSPGFVPAVQPNPSVMYDAALVGTPTINGTNMVEFLSNLTFEETDPTVPDWAKQPNPPAGTSGDGLTTNDVQNIVTNEVVEYTAWTYRCEIPEIEEALNAAKPSPTFLSGSRDENGMWEINNPPSVEGYVATVASSAGLYPKTATTVEFWYVYGVAVDDFNIGFTATRERITRNSLGLARLSDLKDAGISAETATNIAYDAVGTISNDVEEIKRESTLVYRLFSGSNIVMEVTNYNSKVNAPAARLMRLEEDGTYTVVWAETNGLERTYQRSVSNTTLQVENLRAESAPRAWSKTTSGLGADAPENTTWISTPTTVLAGGLEYAKVVTTGGQLWFLRSNGMVANVGGKPGGYFDISASDGTSVFSIEKTDSYMAPVDADGISVNGNTVTIRLSVVSADHPFLRYAPTLNAPVEWQKEEDGFSSPIAVSWTGSSGAWVAIVTTTAKEGFFQFEFFQEGGTKIKNGGAMDVSAGGILCTDGIHRCRPVYNSNGTITWEAF